MRRTPLLSFGMGAGLVLTLFSLTALAPACAADFNSLFPPGGKGPEGGTDGSPSDVSSGSSDGSSAGSDGSSSTDGPQKDTSPTDSSGSTGDAPTDHVSTVEAGPDGGCGGPLPLTCGNECCSTSTGCDAGGCCTFVAGVMPFPGCKASTDNPYTPCCAPLLCTTSGLCEATCGKSGASCGGSPDTCCWGGIGDQFYCNGGSCAACLTAGSTCTSGSECCSGACWTVPDAGGKKTCRKTGG